MEAQDPNDFAASLARDTDDGRRNRPPILKFS